MSAYGLHEAGHRHPITVCWAAKGGSGTTVVSAGLASVTAAIEGSALLVDLAGDAGAVFGLEGRDRLPGVRSWIESTVSAAALDQLLVDAGGGLQVLPEGAVDRTRVARSGRPEEESRWIAFHDWLGSGPPTVIDLGTVSPGNTEELQAVAALASESLLVTRACYLSLRRALDAPLRATGVVLVRELGRRLDRSDVEDVLGVPVVATIDVDESISRAVDAGLLNARMPRELTRALRHLPGRIGAPERSVAS